MFHLNLKRKFYLFDFAWCFNIFSSAVSPRSEQPNRRKTILSPRPSRSAKNPSDYSEYTTINPLLLVKVCDSFALFSTPNVVFIILFRPKLLSPGKCTVTITWMIRFTWTDTAEQVTQGWIHSSLRMWSYLRPQIWGRLTFLQYYVSSFNLVSHFSRIFYSLSEVWLVFVFSNPTFEKYILYLRNQSGKMILKNDYHQFLLIGILKRTEVSYYFRRSKSGKFTLDKNADIFSRKPSGNTFCSLLIFIWEFPPLWKLLTFYPSANNPKGLIIEGGISYETRHTIQTNGRAASGGTMWKWTISDIFLNIEFIFFATPFFPLLLSDGTVPFVSLSYPRVWEKYGEEGIGQSVPKIDIVELQVHHSFLKNSLII